MAFIHESLKELSSSKCCSLKIFGLFKERCNSGDFLKKQPYHFPVMAICFVVREFTYSFPNVFQELG